MDRLMIIAGQPPLLLDTRTVDLVIYANIPLFAKHVPVIQAMIGLLVSLFLLPGPTEYVTLLRSETNDLKGHQMTMGTPPPKERGRKGKGEGEWRYGWGFIEGWFRIDERFWWRFLVCRSAGVYVLRCVCDVVEASVEGLFLARYSMYCTIYVCTLPYSSRRLTRTSRGW